MVAVSLDSPSGRPDLPALPAPLESGPATWPARSHLPLHDELHARPALAVRRPGVVSYWVQWGMTAEAAEAALHAACNACGREPPPPGARHHRLQTAAFDLKFERHGEFVSWQANAPLAQDLGDTAASIDDALLEHLLQEARALDALPAAFAAALHAPGAGQMLAATHVVLLRTHDEQLLPRVRSAMASRRTPQDTPRIADDSRPLVGGWIADGQAAVVTDLQLAPDGFTRLLLLDFGLAADPCAREVQRLCEIEAYRMLAMLGFPVAQQEAQALTQIEEALQHTVDRMTHPDGADDSLAFDALTRMAAEVEHSAARTRYRFSATRAYHQIVQRRLADLRESRIGGMQTLSGFLARRFAPAMALCDSTDARLSDVAGRISRAVGLAQVRIESRREAANQQLLSALAHRQKLQLRLQQTVEGLSVVAISYYALGLIGTVAKGVKATVALPMHPDAVVGLATVPVVLAVGLFVRRLRRHLGDD